MEKMNIKWNYTDKIVNGLLRINSAKEVVDLLELPVSIEEEINIIDSLDKRERWVANFIINNGKIKAKDVANHFKINLDTANNWIKKWIEKEFLVRYGDKQIRSVDYILTKNMKKN